jgi:hypothetical protein
VPQHLSRRAYAKHKGVSESAVRQAIAAQRITVERDGKIDPKKADAQWAKTTDLSKPRNAVVGEPKHRRKPGEGHKPMAFMERAGEAAGQLEDPEVAELLRRTQKSRASSEDFRAKTAELEYEELAGKLVSVDDVVARVFDMTRRARDLLLAIPDRIAADLVGMDPDDAHRLLTGEIRLVLEEISSKPLVPQPKRRGRARSPRGSSLN